MVGSNGAESPLDRVAVTVGEPTIEGLGILGDQTRLAILLALWEAYEPFAEDNAVSFSNLRERVGVRDSGQFNYHLDELVGPFVEQAEDGYTLTTQGQMILRTILAGTLAEYDAYEGEAIDASCDRCGEPMVIDYQDRFLVERCTNCEGRWDHPDYPVGTRRALYRPPVGLKNRSPQEFHRHGVAWNRLRSNMELEGICPDCSGSISSSFYVCDDHDVQEGSVCDECDSFWEIRLRWVCDICKSTNQGAPFQHIFTVPKVRAFYHDHGMNPNDLFVTSAISKIHETIAEISIVSEDPLEVLIAVAIDGDRLEMRLDNEANVVDITQPTD